MIPLLTRQAVRALDVDAVERLGVPSVVLMENAARGAFDHVHARYGDRLERVVVVGGVGQNGGDGWVLARLLEVAGHRPLALLVGDEAKLAGDARVNWHTLLALGIDVHRAALDGPVAGALAGATLIVDALFGTGLDRPIGGAFAEAIADINAAQAPVVALDLPSGVDADTGGVLGVAVRATTTVTFAAHKLGLHQHPGARLAGEVTLGHIGVPGPGPGLMGVLEDSDVARWLVRRAPEAHKGSAGHVLVVAGSAGTTGAALLAGSGALRCGAGLVTLAPRAAREALDTRVLELMTAALPEAPDAAAARVMSLCAGKQAVALGPGLGTDAATAGLCRELARALPLPTVLDADALTALGTELELLVDAAAPRVLTPHPGEAARLLGSDSAAVQADRYAAVRQLAERAGCVVVLKGARSVIAEPGGRLAVCRRGTPAMASAGMGDVLSGCIAALLAGLPAFEAAAAGVHLHARAGELAARADRGLLASELAASLPAALRAVLGA